MIAKTDSAPYYAVIFTSIKSDDSAGYDEMADLMNKLVLQQPGFLGLESARNEIGITVSYWSSLDAIKEWKANYEHLIAQKLGREKWYKTYKIRICRIERDYEFNTSAES